MLVIKIENGLETALKQENGNLKTDKEENGLHGWGLKALRPQLKNMKAWYRRPIQKIHFTQSQPSLIRLYPLKNKIYKPRGRMNGLVVFCMVKNLLIADIPAELQFPEYDKDRKGKSEKEGNTMRHVYIRGILALIWFVCAVVCVISGNFE